MTLYIDGAQAQQLALNVYTQLPVIDSFAVLPLNDKGVGAHLDVFTLDVSGFPIEGLGSEETAASIHDAMLAARAQGDMRTMHGAHSCFVCMQALTNLGCSLCKSLLSSESWYQLHFYCQAAILLQWVHVNSPTPYRYVCCSSNHRLCTCTTSPAPCDADACLSRQHVDGSIAYSVTKHCMQAEAS